jgi:hypothetical protein
MGCDIHPQVEVRREDGWHRVPHPTRPCDDDYCTDGKYNDLTPNESMRGKDHYRCKGTGFYTDAFYDDRNYDVFAILANVRNGYGFAGVDTGDGFVPISEPRGLPEDLSPEIADVLAREEDDAEDDFDWSDPQYFWMGDHSHSWLTVLEILDYDWTRTTKKRGWVDPWQFQVWRRDGKPTMWSGSIEGPSIEHISNVAMARLLDGGEIEWEGDEPSPGSYDSRPYSTSLQRSMREWDLPAGSVGAQIASPGRATHYTQVEWKVGYADVAARFLQILQRDIVPLGAPDDVRLVFGFDS